MKKVILCNYTSSINRGCDAIVKSTADLLHKYGMQCDLAVHNKSYDELFGFEEFDNILYYAELWNKPIERIISAGLEKVFRADYMANKIRQNSVWKELKQSVSFNVGGDTYCYGRHMASLTLNHYCYKQKIPSVFWGFSIDEKAISDKMILEDLEKYTLLCPRESLSKELLIKAGIDEKKICQMVDPAFTLKPKSVLLPDQMKENETIAINISPVVTLNGSSEELVHENYKCLISEILETSNMNIALIPHVYIENDYKQEDLLEAFRLKEEFKNNDRVFIINGFYTSREIKYLISKCRMLFTARTHASIAGYSSCVPTIVIGYSIKARGIATDLFGTYNNYVVQCQKFETDRELINSYEFLLEHEDDIRETLKCKQKYYTELLDYTCKKIHKICDE
ncbi:MAG: polysaccharide pyruvyl transferase family protein [Eisenbergiella sp.]